MDRRSWLWRRKSSDKSPTESCGSVSSQLSERFSDDQTLLHHNIQSPEVTSKAAPDDDDHSVKTLSEKLTEALLNIRAKEDLVKQHAKVAEEAVSGWERAENEVTVLKKQNEALTQTNTILEERVGHLDGALKECLRQLRQSREEWESLRTRLEAAEKDNSIIQLNLQKKTEELELRMRERDLSTHAAETASKQHLDSIKRVAKLEAECRRLKVPARKDDIVEDVKMTGGSQGGRSCSSSSSLMVPSVEIDDLMDDFLEMERLAALPEEEDHNKARLRKEEEDTVNKITGEKISLEIALRESQIQLKASEMKLADLKTQLALANDEKRDVQNEVECTKAELNNLEREYEDIVNKITGEKVSLEIALGKSQTQLKASEMKLVDLKTQLALANDEKRDALECTKAELDNLEREYEDTVNKKVSLEIALGESRTQLKASEMKLVDLKTQLALANDAQNEVECTKVKLNNIEGEYEREKYISREAVAKCHILEAEISKMKSDAQFQRSAIIDEFLITQDKELAVAAGKFAECQKTIASLGRQLKSLGTLEDFLIDSEAVG